MILIEMHEAGSEEEPVGFNCGKSDIMRAQQIADNLRTSLQGGMTIYGPEMINGSDFIVTVMCTPGTLASVTMLVGQTVAIMRRRQLLG